MSTDTRLRSKARELKHGDGGDVDNLALLPLLARRVENILVFINTRSEFSENTVCDRVTAEAFVDDLISLFRPTVKLKDNVVFADGEEQLARLCREFVQRKRAGEPLVYCQRYAIKTNPRQGIEGGNYAPSICWVYLDRTQQWINKITGDHAGKHTADLKNGRGDFRHFPHFKTFGEHGPQVIDLDRERVRALSNLAAWTVYERASYIAEKLIGASLPTDKRPLNFNQ